MSSPATLLSVVCFGLQDTRLLSPRGQPDIRNYAKVLKKTTRWAAQWIRVDFDGQPEFGKRNTCTIPRKAELLTQVTLVTTMPDINTPQAYIKNACPPNKPLIGPSYGWTNSLGHAMINRVELDIGGVNIDQMDGRYLEIQDELYESEQASRSKNRMINRVANGFSDASIGHETNPTENYVNLPFWFSRGNYENALPIDALAADTIQIHVTLNTVNQLYYTNARLDPRNPGYRPNIDVSGAMCPLQGGLFYRFSQDAPTRIFSTNATRDQDIGISGELIPNFAMPTTGYKLGDTYLLCEFISLEDAESVALRSAQLDYRIDQHYIVAPQNTERAPNVRIRMPYNNPTKELIWVAQNPLALNYNAWFLFARDIIGSSTNRSSWWKIPWWPDAILTNTDQSRPAFRYAYSEPIRGAQLSYSNVIRFNHQDNPSFFRTLLPILHYRKAPLYNRYIYVYPFALAPGATDDDSLGPSYNPRGASNWDKLPKKELQITMNPNTVGKHFDLTIYSYVTIHNVFRVFGGRGVTLFAY